MSIKHIKFSFFTLFIFISACSTSEIITEPETVTTSEESQDEIESISATEDWHLSPADQDPFYGTGVIRAYETVLKDRNPEREVIVAIIDSGTDIEHEDLKDNIWVNEDEIPDNGIDDDGNGYVDDIHGWNFIGGPMGEHVGKDTYEVTRLYVKMRKKFSGIQPDSIPDDQLAEYQYYLNVRADFEQSAEEAEQAFLNYNGFYQVLQYAKNYFQVDDIRDLDPEIIAPSQTDTEELAQLKYVASVMQENDFSDDDIKEGVEYFEGQFKYGYNVDFDPRAIVGDNYENLTNRFYGNNDVSGIHNEHGTHVAGIVGAIRNNDIGMDGIADVKLMIIRAVPDGDERDKDVANAILYAAENGADIINMSFGKGYSPQKDYVDAAIQFADSMGVLMVHAAGNDGNDIDTTNNFPSRFYLSNTEATNWITVGASSWYVGEDIPATFSNYGKEHVHLFAPGVDIYSTYPDNEYQANDGTSMAAPVVSGVAALLMSYYPELTATDVKDILMNSITMPEGNAVVKPGSFEEPVYLHFSNLSQSGGIVNAYNAINLIELRSDNE